MEGAMIRAASVLCPVDFSESSGGALRYAAAIAAYLSGRLTLLAVNDPLLAEALEFAPGPSHLTDDTVREVDAFWRQTFAGSTHGVGDVRPEVATGKPAEEILRIAQERDCDVIVMGSQGSTGFRKAYFGSTTERVLRETSTAVLVTPAGDAGPRRTEDTSS